MSSPSRASLLPLALLAAGCDQMRNDPRGHPLPETPPLVSTVLSPVKSDPRSADYQNNAYEVSDGQLYFHWMNCTGCHSEGGGGIGPPLMDDQWTHGGRLDQIYDTIYFGRANGMPAWGGKLTDDQIWKIASYVRSMSLPETLAHNGDGTPSQHPAPVPKEADAFDGWHVPKDAGG